MRGNDHISEAALDGALSRLAAQVSYPQTPDLAPAVRSQLLVRRRQSWLATLSLRGFPRFAVAVALAVLAVGLLLALSPEARTVLADRLGLRGIDMTFVPPLDSLATREAP